MKTIPLITYEVDVTTLVLLKAALESAPSQGLTFKELREHLALLEKLAAVKMPPAVELLLEDEEFERVKTSLASIRWRVVRPYLASFGELFGL